MLRGFKISKKFPKFEFGACQHFREKRSEHYEYSRSQSPGYR